jgi:hypothetical protein
MIRFVLKSDIFTQFEGVGIDAVKILGQSTTDLAITEVSAPTDRCGLTAAETITLDLWNAGLDTIFTGDLSYSVDGGPISTAPLATTLVPGQSLLFSFPVAADLSALGPHTLTVYCSVPGDSVQSNDTIHLSFYHNPDPVIVTSADTTICIGDTVQLTASGAAAFHWWPTANLYDTIGSQVSALTYFSQTFYVSATSDSGCKDTAAINITVEDLTQIRVESFKDTFCAGDTAQLFAMACQEVLDDFNGTGFSSLWQDIGGAWLSTDCGVFSGKALYFGGDGSRHAVTIPLDVSGGGELEFRIKIGNGLPPCEDADVGDHIVLEYSLDGIVWKYIRLYDQDAFPVLVKQTQEIPWEARSAATQFRWRQNDHNGTGFDQWALENMVITTCQPNGNYAFDWTPGVDLNDSASWSPIATTAMTNTFQVEVADACGNVMQGSHTLVSADLKANLADSLVVCFADSVRLDATSNMYGTSFDWSPATDLSCTTCADPMASPGVDRWYYLTTSNHTCQSLDSILVRVVPLPSIDAGSDTGLCQGDTIFLLATGGSTYSWSPTNDLINPFSAFPQVYPAADATFYVTGTSVNGCSNQDSIAVNVRGIRALDLIARPPVVCLGDSVQLDINTCPDLQDDFDPGIDWDVWQTITKGLVGNICGSVSGNALLFDGAGKREARTHEVATINGGLIDFWILISDSGTSCENVDFSEDILLEYSLRNDTNWYLIETFWADSFPYWTHILQPMPIGARSAHTQFRFRQRINDSKDNWAIDNFRLICNGSNTGVDFDWTPGSAVSDPKLRNPKAAPIVATTYSLTVAEGACVRSDSITVGIYNLTDASVTLSANPPNACVGDSIVVTAHATGAGSQPVFAWYVNGSLVAGDDSTLTGYFADQAEIHVVMAPGPQCAVPSVTSDTLILAVSPLPIVSFSGLDTIYCNKDAGVLLTGSPIGGSFSGPGISASTFDPNLAGTGSHKIIYTYSDSLGCAAADTQMVRVKSCIGIDPLVDQRITVWPNPSSGTFFINGVPDRADVFVTDVLGRRIAASYQQGKLTLSGPVAGVYWVHVFSRGQYISVRLVID